MRAGPLLDERGRAVQQHERWRDDGLLLPLMAPMARESVWWTGVRTSTNKSSSSHDTGVIPAAIARTHTRTHTHGSRPSNTKFIGRCPTVVAPRSLPHGHARAGTPSILWASSQLVACRAPPARPESLVAACEQHAGPLGN